MQPLRNTRCTHTTQPLQLQAAAVAAHSFVTLLFAIVGAMRARQRLQLAANAAAGALLLAAAACCCDEKTPCGVSPSLARKNCSKLHQLLMDPTPGSRHTLLPPAARPLPTHVAAARPPRTAAAQPPAAALPQALCGAALALPGHAASALPAVWVLAPLRLVLSPPPRTAAP
jgi:hypothetical protein